MKKGWKKCWIFIASNARSGRRVKQQVGVVAVKYDASFIRSVMHNLGYTQVTPAQLSIVHVNELEL